MEGLAIQEISKMVEGTLQYPERALLGFQPSAVSIDSRTIRKGDIFFALAGQHSDGHQFVEAALSSGASAAIVRQDWLDVQHRTLPGVLVGVKDPLEALQKLAWHYRRRFSIPVVAITGTNGKTTVKDMTAAVLETTYGVLKTKGNLNNHIGVPLTILELSSKHQVAVMELGMSGTGELTKLSELADPSVGVITNVGPGHLEFFDSVEQIAAAKGELLDYLAPSALAILNGDDPLVMAQASRMKGDTITFGLSETCDFRAEDIDVDVRYGTRFTVRNTPFQLRIPGKYNIYNALAALSVGASLRVDLRDARHALGRFRPSPMRMEVLQRGGICIINDAYNANPVSTKAALDVLSRFPTGPDGRRIAMLGDMLELGSSAHSLHRELGRYVAQSGIDRLFLLGPLSEMIREGAYEAGMSDQHVGHFVSHDAAIQWIKSFCRAGDVVLVKGSRAMKMEAIVEAMEPFG